MFRIGREECWGKFRSCVNRGLKDSAQETDTGWHLRDKSDIVSPLCINIISTKFAQPRIIHWSNVTENLIPD